MKKTGSHSLSALIRLALAADPGTGAAISQLTDNRIPGKFMPKPGP
jgi:hypothetical protein